MRKSVLIATFSVAVALGGKWLLEGDNPSPQQLIGVGIALSMLAFLSLFRPMSGLVDAFAYVLVLVLALNDGADIINRLSNI